MKFAPVAVLFAAAALAADSSDAQDSKAASASGSGSEAAKPSGSGSEAAKPSGSEAKDSQSAKETGSAKESGSDAKGSGSGSGSAAADKTSEVVTVEGTTVTVDPEATVSRDVINQFSDLYAGPYSSDIQSYASALAVIGYPATKISSMLSVYRYGKSQMQDQTSYDTYLSQWVVVQKSDVSVRGTKSYSFSPETTEVLEFDNESEASEYLRTHTEGGDDNSKSDDSKSGDKKSDSKSDDKKSDDKKSDSKSNTKDDSKSASDDKSSSQGGSADAKSESGKNDGVSFVAPVGAMLGALAVALM
ncbi:hypothetical protein DIURU_004680 [Diutina rugosa]|uniref:Uncharacterized protein n=1 Tax=Diutina rugosa TaxID=5481 RepID=A0A642UIL3_DIURU|nr:uncharacterized protein DIURU_004680 [Diutina rugosa]KAA8898396.1 hypothetical protein DIURU_004680 [Diutina rugosa]